MKKDVLDNLIEKYWFAPADVLLRLFDAQNWQDRKINRPILDLGCGDGELSRFVYEGLPKIDMGIDLEEQNIREAQEPNHFLKMQADDATELSFKDCSFASVLSNSTFEHIDNDIQAVKECKRVLRKEGKLYFCVPAPGLEKNVLKIEGSVSALNKFNKRIAHFHYRSLSEWEEILEKNGFRKISANYYFPDPVFFLWYRLFKLATTHVYHRELWSYLKDSCINKIFPKFIPIFLWKLAFRRFLNYPKSNTGNWIFIEAQKI